MKKYVVFFLPLFLSFFMIGCSGNYPLKGRVTFSDDGSPLEIGYVCFENDKGIARGKIQKDGYYVVGYVGATDGIPQGTYDVYITGAQIKDPKNRNKGIPLVESNQCRAGLSGWTFLVDGSTKTYDIQVNRPRR
jgi:hypothetical protein